MPLSDARAKLIARLHRRKTRQREGAVLVEGPHAIEEALAAGVPLKFAVASESFGSEADRSGGLERVESEILSRLAAALPRGSEDLHRVDDRALPVLADTETPQGLLLVVKAPAASPDLIRAPGRWLVLDGVQDPGNVGTLIRAAAAFACDGVVALPGTADPWGTRTVRASAGTVFRLPVVSIGSDDLQSALDRLPRPVLVAEAGGAGPGGVTPRSWSLVLGNEGTGPRDELRAAGTRTLSIPMPGGVESLNVGVAGAILLYALTSARDIPRPRP